jgi:hypothetical protein
MKSQIDTRCVPSTMLCLFIYGIALRRAVRVAVFKINETTNHVQAQVQDEEGNWQYLTEVWTGRCIAALIYGKPNYPKVQIPFKYMSVREFFEEQIQLFVGRGEVK